MVALARCAPKGEALLARAETALDKGEVRAAIIDLQALIQIRAPKRQGARAARHGHARRGNVPGAEIELERRGISAHLQEMLLVPSCRVLAAKAETDEVLADCEPETGPAASRADLHMLTGTALLIASRATEAKQHSRPLSPSPRQLDALLGLPVQRTR